MVKNLSARAPEGEQGKPKPMAKFGNVAAFFGKGGGSPGGQRLVGAGSETASPGSAGSKRRRVSEVAENVEDEGTLRDVAGSGKSYIEASALDFGSDVEVVESDEKEGGRPEGAAAPVAPGDGGQAERSPGKQAKRRKKGGQSKIADFF